MKPQLRQYAASLRPDRVDEIPFLIFFSFLTTFILARLIVNFFPDLFLQIGGVHIHHFAYGIIILTLVGALELIIRPHGRVRNLVAIVFGIGMGLAYDEFGMWLKLENNYFSELNYDAVIVIALILLNVIYFEGFRKKMGIKFFPKNN